MNRTVHGRALRLDAILSNAAISSPEQAAVVFQGKSQTYAEINDRARRLAGTLASLDVQKGDRVAFWAANRPEFLEVIFGVSLLGAIAVPLDHWWQQKDAFAALAQVRPKILILGAAQVGLLAALGPELTASGVAHVLSLDDIPGTSHLSYEQALAQASPLAEPTAVSALDPALILFTSGSTGRSKGAVHTHGGLCATAMIMAVELGLRDSERTLHFLPLFSSCLEHVIPLTLVRATHVIMPQFDASVVWSAIVEHKITHFDAVPTILRRMLDCAPAIAPSSLRLITYASEPMPAPLIAELLQRLPETEFVQFYGMIEQLCVTVQGPSQHRTKAGTVGRPMLGAELLILRPDGEPAAQNDVGEIHARTPTMFAGYWSDPETTAQVMSDGWMKTGDVGYMDRDGFLVLSGRTKEVIKSGGVTVIPGEVEAALVSHPFVREAAVIGIPDDFWGEAVHAFVVLNTGATITGPEIIAFCRQSLTGYKTPKHVHFVDTLPRTGIGKISRREIRDQFLQAREAEVAA